MKRYEKKDATFTERDASQPSGGAPDEASARRIVDDYLHQVSIRLPSAMARDVIPELRSHLLEQASQPKGRLTPDAAWNAVVAMGSPESLAHEFRREATAAETGRIGGGLLSVLKPVYRAWFWRIAVGFVISDVLLLATFAVVAITAWHPITITTVITSGIAWQVWFGAGISIVYLVFLLLSNPRGLPLGEILHSFFERPDRKERRVLRAQRRLRHRAQKVEELVGRRSLSLKMGFQVAGGMCLSVIAVFLTYLVPAYPLFDILFLLFMAGLGFVHAIFMGLRVYVDGEHLNLARILAYLEVLWGLPAMYAIGLLFYGVLELPIPIWDSGASAFQLLFWKPYLAMFSWLGIVLGLLVLLSMVIQVLKVSFYLLPSPPEPGPPS